MKALTGALLGAAAAGALVRTASASPTARTGGSVVAAVLISVIVGVARGRNWALGASFFLGLFGLWAALALLVQGDLTGFGALGAVAWALAVMVCSVRAYSREREGLHPEG